MIRQLTLVACFALVTTGCYGQQTLSKSDSDIITDRPDVTESSIVVPRDSLQVENGIAWTNNHGNRGIDLPETLIRLGLTDRTEIRIQAPNYATGLSSEASGLGDVALGFKQQLGPLRAGFDLSVIVAASLPTGAADLSSHGVDPFVKLPWSWELRHGWSVGGMPSVFWNTEHRRRTFIWEATLYLEKEIAKPFAVFAEYSSDSSEVFDSRQVAHFGGTVKITSRQLLDFHFGFGLTHGAPSQFVGLGYSFRIDRLFDH